MKNVKNKKYTDLCEVFDVPFINITHNNDEFIEILDINKFNETVEMLKQLNLPTY